MSAGTWPSPLCWELRSLALPPLPGDLRLCDDAGVQQGHLSHGRGDPEPGASEMLPRQAGVRDSFYGIHRQELREYMAKLGVRTVDELVGRSDLLKAREEMENPRGRRIDLQAVLSHPWQNQKNVAGTFDFGLEKTLDVRGAAGKAWREAGKGRARGGRGSGEKYGSDLWHHLRLRDHPALSGRAAGGYLPDPLQRHRRTELRRVHPQRTDQSPFGATATTTSARDSPADSLSSLRPTGPPILRRRT